MPKKIYVWSGSAWEEITVATGLSRLSLKELEISTANGFTENVNITVTKGTGSKTATQAYIPSDVSSIEVLMVGGGGGGGQGGRADNATGTAVLGGGGGGGAGGVIHNVYDISSVSSFTVVLGAGGAGGTGATLSFSGSNGSSSSLTIGATTTTAAGGGGGGAAGPLQGANGGSGGGSGTNSNPNFNGNANGIIARAGGGGGAGGPGGQNSANTSGLPVGGTLTSSSGIGFAGKNIVDANLASVDASGVGGLGLYIMGRAVAGGGHGGNAQTSSGSVADLIPAMWGAAEAPAGDAGIAQPGANAVDGTGAGGNGGGTSSNTNTRNAGGKGGSGIIVIRYYTKE